MNAKLKAPIPPHPSITPAKLRVTKGPYKGVVYKLVAGKITIGRSSENDIALVNDDKVSRKQALLKLEKEGHYVIKDLSNRASLKLNNIVTLKSNLQDGDLIQCGTTVLQFESPAPLPHPNVAGAVAKPAPALGIVPPAPAHAGQPPLPSVPHSPTDPLPLNPAPGPQAPLSLMENATPPQHPPPFPHSMEGTPQHKPKTAGKQNKKLKPKIIGLILALIFLYLFLSDSDTQNIEKEDKLRTQMEKEENVQTLQELEKTEIDKRQKNKLISYKHAQFAYIKGIRDYRKGVYNRAVESFRTCKTIYPQHELCGAYLEKAQAKSQQLIQAWMIAGKAYREKRRFAPCMSSFKNVMTAIRDKSNLTYKEAYENYKICQLQYEDRY